MRTNLDVKRDRFALIQKQDEDVQLLEKVGFSDVLKKELRKTIEAYYQPMIVALNIESAVRADYDEYEPEKIFNG